MSECPIIEKTITNACHNFNLMMTHFIPAREETNMTERNISFQFAHSFSTMKSNAAAFMEVPYLNTETGKWDLHIDCYCGDADIGIFLECKRFHSVGKLDEIRTDAENRLTKENTKAALERFANPMPRTVYALVIADTWYDGYKKWWLTGEGDTERWNWDTFLKGWTRGSRAAAQGNWEEDNTMHWVYGYRVIS